MEDRVVFLKTLDLEGEKIFKEGSSYIILDENKDDIFVQMKKGTNQVSQIPKSNEGTIFKYE